MRARQSDTMLWNSMTFRAQKEYTITITPKALGPKPRGMSLKKVTGRARSVRFGGSDPGRAEEIYNEKRL